VNKFYVHRTYVVEVTEVTEVEAENENEAEIEVYNGGGDYVGMSVGDAVSFTTETVEVLPAAPHNIPAVFLWAKGVREVQS
jgi:hypothetical protein